MWKYSIPIFSMSFETKDEKIYIIPIIIYHGLSAWRSLFMLNY